MIKPVIYTIGHSTHETGYFLELLKEHRVTCIIDVRSTAASSYNPQYNKENLSAFLKQHGITYLHFANEFGARHTDKNLLDAESKVDFEKVRKTKDFKNGIERVWAGIEKGFTISLMCSESNPFECHRFSMVSVALQAEGFEVKHILKDKSLQTNSELEQQMLEKFDAKIPKPDLFNPVVTPQDQLKAAYRLHNREIAFSPLQKAAAQQDD